MGGAVSSGRDNNELIDNLMGGNYIRTREVERVFRALDRAEYMTPEARDQAYKDLAWRNGPLHMSAPCIYSEVMEGLELKPGLSFLNVGSGTGYLSTLVGLILGSSGINHGVEVVPLVFDYANRRLGQFQENSPILDDFDFCEPKFYLGNGLCLAPLQAPYDRVYCGAGCPEEYQNYFQQLIKVGGILVMPLNDNLVQVRRTGPTAWSSRTLLNVSFASLRVPSKEEAQDLIRLEEQTPTRLQALARAVIRSCMRGAMRRRHPHLREPPPRAPPAKKACPRRICIPVEDDSDAEGLNALHDLDRATGASEMNALLSLVLSMGHNRVAGALRIGPLDSHSDSSSEEGEDNNDDRRDDDDGDNDDGEDRPDRGGAPVAVEAPASREAQEEPQPTRTEATRPNAPENAEERLEPNPRPERSVRNIIMFEVRNSRETPNSLRDRIHALNRTLNRGRREESREESSEERASTSKDDDDSSKECSPPKETRKVRPSCSKDNQPSGSKARYHRRRGSKAVRRNPTTEEPPKESEDTEKTEKDPDVPAEVEIYLGKSREAPSTSAMDWEPSEAKDTSEEDTETSSKTKEEKRQKLDSGIGEENSPSAGSSSNTGKSDDDDDEVDDQHQSDSATDEGCEEDRGKDRRRRQKRGHLSTRSSSSTSGEGEREGEGEGARRLRRRARFSDDARRVGLSLVMKRGVKELPLPHALKKYVNLGRCFEF